MPRLVGANVQSCWSCGADLEPVTGQRGGARPGKYLRFLPSMRWAYVCDRCRNRSLTRSAKRTATMLT